MVSRCLGTMPWPRMPVRSAPAGIAQHPTCVCKQPHLSASFSQTFHIRLVPPLRRPAPGPFPPGDYTPDLRALLNADIIICTPEKWDGISRAWQTRGYVKKVRTNGPLPASGCGCCREGGLPHEIPCAFGCRVHERAQRPKPETRAQRGGRVRAGCTHTHALCTKTLLRVTMLHPLHPAAPSLTRGQFPANPQPPTHLRAGCGGGFALPARVFGMQSRRPTLRPSPHAPRWG